MMHETDPTVVVIGAGLSGISTAYFLSKLGHKVTVLDRNHAPGSNTLSVDGRVSLLTSLPEAGVPAIMSLKRRYCPWKLFVQMMPDTVNKNTSFQGSWWQSFYRSSWPQSYGPALQNLVGFASYSRQLTSQIAKDVGMTTSERVGEVRCYIDSTNFADGKYTQQLLRDTTSYVESFVLTADQTVAIAPPLQFLSQRIKGSVFSGLTYILSPDIMVQQLEGACKKNGVQFQYGTNVAALNVDTSNGKVLSAVVTSSADITGDAFVLCTGADTKELTDRSKVKTSIPIIPLKYLGLTIQPPSRNNSGSAVKNVAEDSGASSENGRQGYTGALHFSDAGLTFSPIGADGSVRVLKGYDTVGFDITVDNTRYLDMLKTIHRVMPWVKKKDIPEAEASFRSGTPDGLPMIGKLHKHDNLYINSGHGPHTMSLFAGSGYLCASLIANDLKQRGYKGRGEVDAAIIAPCDVDPSPFDPNRFNLW